MGHSKDDAVHKIPHYMKTHWQNQLKMSVLVSFKILYRIRYKWIDVTLVKCPFKEKHISRRVFLGLLQMLKPKSFRGHCPLDPRWGSAPGPQAVRCSARFARSAFMDTKLLALTRHTNTKFVPTGLV